MISNQLFVAVKGLILHKGKVLIVKRSLTDEYGGGTWEFAGGKIEFGEALEEALIREVKEEVGLDVDIQRLLYAGEVKTKPTKQVVVLTYLCSSSDDLVRLSHEHSDYRWVTKTEALSLLNPDVLADFKKVDLSSIHQWTN